MSSFTGAKPLNTQTKSEYNKGTGKRGHIVADTIVNGHDTSWAAQTGKHLLRTQNVSEQNQKHFLCPGICVRNKCCARGHTGKHLCRQQYVLVCQGLMEGREKALFYLILVCHHVSQSLIVNHSKKDVNFKLTAVCTTVHSFCAVVIVPG